MTTCRANLRGLIVGKVSREKAITSEKNRRINYGNLEYVTMMRFLYLLDDHVAKCLDYLIEYWPSLTVCVCVKNHISPQGMV